ncbi:cytochrome P450 6A1-like [Apis cerana]|uniref:cytochrome P450 6A1-like n=1 Tax=Apis cerana TaxID=7461 RepID=UPI002B23832A|nr:cytochrome P450 6A1-like [Apis cerana]
MAYIEILCGIIVSLLALYYYFVSAFNFWKIRGIPGPKPKFLFGNFMDIILSRISTPTFIKNIYDTYTNEPMVGLYVGRNPILFLKDPELIKDVLIRDFSKFADRGFNVHEKVEPLSQHLFNLEPKRWRPLRSKLSPIFTSKKLKEMFNLILECGHHFEKYLDELAAQREPVDFREVAAKYTTDVIGSCAFGIKMNAMSNEESEFREAGRKIFEPTWNSIIRLKFKMTMPTLYDLLGPLVPEREVTPFFIKVVTDTMKYRKENNVFRPDFIDTLMKLRDDPGSLGDIELTDAFLTAQAYVFFAAGFETGASTISNTLYELAQSQEIQDKLRQEIREHYDKYKGELIYENIKEMEYLDKVFQETLRKYPPGTLIPRRSVSDYTFKNTNVTIPKDTMIWIPAFPIHRDPNIYPNPDDFNPENFTEDAINNRHPMNYLAFSNGPRNCIGARFANYQVKVGLIMILRNYKVEVCEKTMIPYQFDPNLFLLGPKGGIYLKIMKV